MTAALLPSALLACPRCDNSPLAQKDSGFKCTGCKTVFPALNGIPWLFAEPDATLGSWRGRLHFSLQQLAGNSQKIEAELKSTTLDPLTRKRLQQQLEATTEHRKMLRQLLAPVDIQSLQANQESYLAMRTRLPLDQGIHTYYANIHRDWAWGDTENNASLEQIRSVVDKGPSELGTTLVLGAGACRLAYDIHMQLDSKITIATDFNPLLLLVAKSVTDGQAVPLYEFPLAPKSIDDFAVLRSLAAPEPATEGFHLVFSDALRPPFALEAFDTVVTPWLLDVVGDDLSNQSARINNLLKTGGRWINFGSVTFDHPDYSKRHSAEELMSIVTSNGFDQPVSIDASIPYMCSPASRHARQETVLTFAATKSEKVKKPARHKALPDWVVTGKLAVPLTQSFHQQAASTQIHSYIMSLIDGKRTIEDMAVVLENQKLMTKEEAIPAIRSFLIRMFDDSHRSSGF